MAPGPLPHRPDGGGARHESGQEARDGQAEAGSESAERHVTGCVDRHDQDGELPDRARVDRAKWPDRPIGSQGQDHQGRRAEKEGVVQLLLGQDLSNEAVQLGPSGEEDGDDDRDTGGEHRLADRERPQQRRGDQRDLGRQTRVARRRPKVGGRRQSADDQDRGDQDPLAPERQTETPREAGEAEGADTRRPAAGAGPLAALPLRPDQQADRQRDGESEGELPRHDAIPRRPLRPIARTSFHRRNEEVAPPGRCLARFTRRLSRAIFSALRVGL